jgi:hypothetical protein
MSAASALYGSQLEREATVRAVSRESTQVGIRPGVFSQTPKGAG